MVPGTDRTHHPIINGQFPVLTMIYIYLLYFQGQSVMKMGLTFHQMPIHLDINLTVDQMIGLHITIGSNLKWPTSFTAITRCPQGKLTSSSNSGLPLLQVITIYHLFQVIPKCTTPSTQPPLAIFHHGWVQDTMFV